MRLNSCADDVTVDVYLNGFLSHPITLQSGSGSNKMIIQIDQFGNVAYNWVKQTWLTHFRDAGALVKKITRSILGGFASFFGSLLGSNNGLPGSSKQYLTY